jgi:M6 family metalloprotease-like protein
MMNILTNFCKEFCKKYTNRICFGVAIFFFIIGVLANTGTLVFALEPPTKEEIEQYRIDGTLDERIEYAKALGNHLVSPNLAARLIYKLQRLILEMRGYTTSEIDEILAPPPAWEGMPTSGTVNILAILIAFSDYPPSNSASSISSKLFGNGAGGYPYESLHNYYDRSSYNQLNIQGNVLGWYTTAYPRNNVPQTTAGRENLIKEVLNYYDSQGHDFTQYDNDGDGTIDYLVVIWTGPDTGWGSFWWGYMTYFTDSSYLLDGKKLDIYSWQWEANPYPGNFTPKVVIHETGHALGLPDYYDYDPSIGPDGGVGGLDMMDANWGDHNCFSKFLLDWITPTIINSGTQILSLNASSSSPDAVVIMSGFAPEDQFAEFFMVQNRHRSYNDITYPNDGLLIWHVDARLDNAGWDYLYNNSFTEHKLLRLMEADGLEEIEQNLWADAGDYYTIGDTFGPNTTPNSNNYDGACTGVTVSDISVSGLEMTAKFSISPVPDIKANGSDGPITITTANNLLVTVELDAGNSSGFNADWWVLADTPFGWYHYNVASNSWFPGLIVTYQGPLFDLAPYVVLNMSGLPTGTYIIYFGVDTNMNSSVDMDVLFFDSVDVNVTP